MYLELLRGLQLKKHTVFCVIGADWTFCASPGTSRLQLLLCQLPWHLTSVTANDDDDHRDYDDDDHRDYDYHHYHNDSASKADNHW